MSGRYAAGTEVPVDRSKAELERTLTRYGATAFAYAWDVKRVMIGFSMHGRMIRFFLDMPDPESDEFWITPTGKGRTQKAASDAYDQEVRRRWRALNLVIKAKLEAVESGISNFDSEFLASILLPNGQTYGQFALPQVAEVYRTGEMPALLPSLERGR